MRLLTLRDKTRLLDLLRDQVEQSIKEELFIEPGKAITEIIKKAVKRKLISIIGEELFNDFYEISDPIKNRMDGFKEFSFSFNPVGFPIEDVDSLRLAELKKKYHISDCYKYTALNSIRIDLSDFTYPTNTLNHILDSFVKEGEERVSCRDIFKLERLLTPEELSDTLELIDKRLEYSFIKKHCYNSFISPPTSSRNYDEFLRNIVTWEELKRFKENWYNILYHDTEDIKMSSEKKIIDLRSGKTIEDNLKDLRKDLGYK